MIILTSELDFSESDISIMKEVLSRRSMHIES